MIFNPEICAQPFSMALVRATGQKRKYHPYLRRAVRAVVQENGKYLLVYSAEEGDYKFPGGGVMAGESHADALRREVLEETGRTLKQLKTLLGTTIELDFPKGADTSVFRMISFYYLCDLRDGESPLTLDPYENELGFTPVWVTPQQALRNNEELGFREGSDQLFWLARETAVLRALIRMCV